MTQEEEITRNMSLIEYYKEQLQTLEVQSQYLQAALVDYNKAKLTLQNLKKTDKTPDILMPLGAGIYLNGTVTDATRILVDVGAGYVTEKQPDDAIQKIEERIKHVQENQEKMNQMAEQLQQEIHTLTQKTQKLYQETQQ